MRRRRVILSIAFLLATGGAWYLYHRVDSVVRNAYAVEWVAGMIVDHLKAHDGDWPRNWDDLRDDYELGVRKVGRPWTLDELRDRVVVDWSADSQLLAAQARQSPTDGTPPFHVIRPVDGSTDHWRSTEPNEIIAAYFRKNSAVAH